MSLKQRFLAIKAEIKQRGEDIARTEPRELADGGYEYVLVDDEDRLTLTLQGERIVDAEFFASIIETAIVTDDEMKAAQQMTGG